MRGKSLQVNACFTVFKFLSYVHFLLLFSPGYIDLSKRRVSPEEAIKCEDKFTKSKTVCFCFFLYETFVFMLSRLSCVCRCTAFCDMWQKCWSIPRMSSSRACTSAQPGCLMRSTSGPVMELMTSSSRLCRKSKQKSHKYINT